MTQSRFRADIQGLRAVAVLLVMAYHAGVPAFTGGYVGVDVFLVISGFLMTQLLLRELESTGKLSLPGFYARRVRRLLPASTAVIVIVLALSRALLPVTRWAETAKDALASIGFVVNWRLADQAVDYLRNDLAPSPLQHFWSLSVEEQFYLGWPALLLLAVVVARRLGRPARHGLVVAVALAAAVSFVASVQMTQADPQRAFFVTSTRIWELAVGGAIALATARAGRLPRQLAVTPAWAGLVVIVASGIAFTASSAFPGWVALIPVLATAVVIATGDAAGDAGPVQLLRVTPLQRVGDWSYSLYLWHWPLLILAGARYGPLSAPQGTAIAVASVLPAYLTYRYVEQPVRRGRVVQGTGPSLRFGAVLVASSVAAASISLALVPAAAPPVPGAPGAGVLGPDARDDPSGAPVGDVPSITPDPLRARADLDECMTLIREGGIRACPTRGAAGASRDLVLLGDSHAAQWTPALDLVAQRRDLRLVTFTKQNCPYVGAADVVFSLQQRPNTSCRAWNDAVRQRLLSGPRPALVVVSAIDQSVLVDGRAQPRASSNAVAAAGFRAAWAELVALGVPVLVLHDTPAVGIDIPDCVAGHRHELTRCAVDRTKARDVGHAQEQAAAGLSGIHVLDLNDAICPTERCAPVIGGVLVYRDGTHVTATYMRTLTPRLERVVAPLLLP